MRFKLKFHEDSERDFLTILDKRRKGTTEVKVDAAALFNLLADYDTLLRSREKGGGKMTYPEGDYRNG